MYTIKQAALRTGVSVPLLRAWERRYGVVEPRRTASGYRLYDDDAVERLRVMRHLVGRGWTPSEAARAVLAGEVPDTGEDAGFAARDAVAREASGAREAAAGGLGPDDANERAAVHVAGAPARVGGVPALPPTGQAAALVARIVEAAARLDTDALERALDDAYAAATFERATEEVVLPALRAIGARWADRTLDVASEHAASAAIAGRLTSWFNAALRPGPRVDAVIGLPPGARHELGALAFAAAARRAGVAVLYLGADVPVSSWRDAVERTRAGIAVVAVPTRADVGPATDVLHALASLEPPIVRAVGGASAGAVGGSDVLRLPDSLVEASALLRQRLGLPA